MKNTKSAREIVRNIDAMEEEHCHLTERLNEKVDSIDSQARNAGPTVSI